MNQTVKSDLHGMRTKNTDVWGFAVFAFYAVENHRTCGLVMRGKGC